MTVYSAVGSATADSGACGVGVRGVLVAYKYREGSTVFSCQKAANGVLEAVAIKSVRLVLNQQTFGRIVPLYQDTFNRLWNENELCDEATAIVTATSYLQAQQDALTDWLLRCSTK